jgi:hypothetical protein
MPTVEQKQDVEYVVLDIAGAIAGSAHRSPSPARPGRSRSELYIRLQLNYGAQALAFRPTSLVFAITRRHTNLDQIFSNFY